MQRLVSVLLLSCPLLAACSGLPGPAPTHIADEAARLPLLRFGEALPAGDHYVLYFPAGTPLPIRTVVDGSAFTSGGAATLHVVLKQGIYGYRQYASLDAKHWMPWQALLVTRLQMRIPGQDGQDAAVLHLQMDAH